MKLLDMLQGEAEGIRPMDQFSHLMMSLRDAGFGGEIETDQALLMAMSTDNSVYQILPDLVVAPRDAQDMVTLVATLEQPDFQQIGITARGGGTGTNGQSLNAGVIVDTRRHMTRILEVDAISGWADVEPGLVLDDLNEQLRPRGWFFAPETSTSTRCTIGGMVSTDASGKGSRVYGKTSDNIIGLEIARAQGLLSSLTTPPAWALTMLTAAETATRAGRAAFVANTPRLNRRFTGYDLERACPESGGFEWWRLFLGAEGTLGLISRIRVKLRRLEPEKRLIVAGFGQFRQALMAAGTLMAVEPTAIEVMDEHVQKLAAEAGILDQLPPDLRAAPGQGLAYVFIEFNGDSATIEPRLQACEDRLRRLEGVQAIYMARDWTQIRSLWAIRSAGVGLLGKVKGAARPVAFVEDCVVPPASLPAFLDEFLAILNAHQLQFGIYGHADVGCLHVRPALNIDQPADRKTLQAVSDAVFQLTRKYGGIFWGEHGKGVRGVYLRDWIGEAAYLALCNVKEAFDPQGRCNPGKLVAMTGNLWGIANTPFRPFNAPPLDPLGPAFQCNGNAQCLSYEAAVPMCPSFKASADLRLSPKGRADGLRAWHQQRSREGRADPQLEADLMASLDSCLGCKACATSCPIQVDIPTLRSVFYADYFTRHQRRWADRLALGAERYSPLIVRAVSALRLVWPGLAPIAGKIVGSVDLPRHLAKPVRARYRLRLGRAMPALGEAPVILVQDWFSVLFDEAARDDIIAGLEALGYRPWVLAMHPAGKMAQMLGDLTQFHQMATRLTALLHQAAALGAPLIGQDPAFVMQLRQDYPKNGIKPPPVWLPQEFLAQDFSVRSQKAGRLWPQAQEARRIQLFSHCTESTALPASAALWRTIFASLGLEIETPATGCCGMAGLFGHQARHQSLSRTLFARSWQPKIKPDQLQAVSGFSCRCQMQRLTQSAPRHPLGLIAEALK